MNRSVSCRRAGICSRLASREPCGLVRTAGRVAWAVGVRAGPGELATVDDQVLVANRALIEPALEDLPDACRVASLRRERVPDVCGVIPWWGIARQG